MGRLKKIRNRWVPEDGFGIGHPIHTDELEEDIRYLFKVIGGRTTELVHRQKELELASNYIAENEVIHKKFKKDIPTVIEYQGRKYILEQQAVNKHAKD